MSDKLRVIQVGCGDRTRSPITAMNQSSRIELVAVCDKQEEKRREIGAEFGISQLYGNLTEMIQTEKPDLVNVVTLPKIRLPFIVIEEAVAAGAFALLVGKTMALPRRIVAVMATSLIRARMSEVASKAGPRGKRNGKCKCRALALLTFHLQRTPVPFNNLVRNI